MKLFLVVLTIVLGPWTRAWAEPSLVGYRALDQRDARLAACGGSDETEQAVTTALGWLKSRQHEGGSWGSNNPMGSTALAVLAFLGHDGKVFESEHAGAVTAGLNFLMGMQTGEGALGNVTRFRGLIDHGQGMAALAEAFVLSGRKEYAESAGQAMRFLLQAEQPEGGWYLGSAPSTRVDTLAVIWQMHHLDVARLCGVEVPEFSQVVHRALTRVKGMVDQESGRLGTRLKGFGSADMSGAGIYAFRLGGSTNQVVINRFIKQTERNLSGMHKKIRWSLPGTYFANLGLYGEQGSLWATWYEQVVEELLSGQLEDGSWKIPPKAGTKDPEYSTALITLILETCYRYPVDRP